MQLQSQTLKVQQGLWIAEQWLQSAGLGHHVQVLVEQGEIRIVPASTEAALPEEAEEGWNVFRTLGNDAPVGKFTDASLNHDRYLYGKP